MSFEVREPNSDVPRQPRTRRPSVAAVSICMSPVLLMTIVTVIGICRFVYDYRPVNEHVVESLVFQQSFLEIGWPTALLTSFFALLVYLIIVVARRRKKALEVHIYRDHLLFSPPGPPRYNGACDAG